MEKLFPPTRDAAWGMHQHTQGGNHHLPAADVLLHRDTKHIQAIQQEDTKANRKARQPDEIMQLCLQQPLGNNANAPNTNPTCH